MGRGSAGGRGVCMQAGLSCARSWPQLQAVSKRCALLAAPPCCPVPACRTAGDPTQTIPQLVKDTGASLLVTDFGPLRLGRQWREEVCRQVEVPVHEVDAHNVVPVWVASGAGARQERAGGGAGRGQQGRQAARGRQQQHQFSCVERWRPQ